MHLDLYEAVALTCLAAATPVSYTHLDVYKRQVTSYCPVPGVGPKSPADNGYKPGFAAELMLKDLTLAQEAAQSADADTPMGALARTLYAQFVTEEDGRGRDFSAMLPRLLARGHS